MKVTTSEVNELQKHILIEHEELALIIKKYIFWNNELGLTDNSVITELNFQSVMEDDKKIGTQCDVLIVEKINGD